MKAMIISVGGTAEPVAYSILQHKPEFVCFFASQQSVETVAAVRTMTRESGYSFRDYKVICDDVNDLIHCYERALQCSQKLQEIGIDPNEVVVDYTGGTKTMTAALTLATVGHGYGFSYIGGKERTKGGLGVVVTGTEVVRTGISPWQIFAVEEKKRIGLLVASSQYEAAITIMRQTLPALVPREQTIWSGILLTLEGYRAWDNFDHAGAVKHLSSGLRDLEVCCSFSQDHHLTGYTHSVRANFADLNEMSRQTNFFKKLHLALVHDLTSNARRRAAQNKYDDAIARLYRALEMMGQVAFEECTGCTTSNVPLEKIPRRLQKEYSHKYGSGDNKQLKLPLFATFRVLAEMNEPVGLNFIEHKKDFDGLIFTRNNSILAHGVAAVEKNTYEKFEALIKELLGRNSFIEFPRLDW